MVTGCVRPNKKTSTVTFTFPKTTGHFSTNNKTLQARTIGQTWGLESPKSFDELNCFAVLVELADHQSPQGFCTGPSGLTMSKPHLGFGLFPQGSQVQLEIPSGSSRKFQLLGWKSSVQCSPAQLMDRNQYSAPFIIGTQVVDLAAGETTDVPIEAKLESTGEISDCSEVPWQGGGLITSPIATATLLPTSTPTPTSTTTATPTPIPTPIYSTSTSLVTVSQATVASGSSTNVTLTARDSLNNTLPMATAIPVSFTLSTSTGPTGTFAAITDNGDGTYSSILTLSGGTGSVTLGAYMGGVLVTSSMPSISVTPGVASVAFSSLSVSNSTVVSGNSVTVTLQSKDSSGNPFTYGGLPVAFSYSGGSSSGSFGSVTDNLNGSYTATFTGAIAGSSISISATIGGVSVTSTLPTIMVLPGSASLATSLITVSGSSVSSGSSRTVMVTTKDAAGNNLTSGGLGVSFGKSGGTSTGNFSGTIDNGDGTYSSIFTGLAAGTATSISATIGGSSVTSTAPTITVTPGTASAANSTLTVSSNTVIAGNSVTITLQAKDNAGNSLNGGGSTVAFSYSGGTSTGTISVASDLGDGTYSATFTGNTAGSPTTINGILNGFALTSTLPTVYVTPGSISTTNSFITISNSNFQFGQSEQATLIAKDNYNNLLTHGGATVTFSTSGGSSAVSFSAVTDLGNGTYAANLTGSIPGTTTALFANINGTTATLATPLTVNPLSLTVAPVYPSNGANWNDYVAFDNTPTGTNLWDQDDSPCTGSEMSYYGESYGCIHGGELRKVSIPGISNCNLLTLEDSLLSFNWKCELKAGVATFYSTGLKEKKGLRDLISTGGYWELMSVILRSSGTIVGTSSPNTWWSNPVTPIAPNPVSITHLSSPGTIYYTNSTLTILGLNINSPKTSIVTLGSASLLSTGTFNQNFMMNECFAGSPAGSQMICADSVNYLWLEANVNNSNGNWPLTTGIKLKNSRFSRINNSFVANSTNPTMIINRSARYTTDGTIDVNFFSSMGSGFNGTVNTVVHDPSTYKIYVGGSFNIYNGVSRPYIARLNLDGSLDTTFALTGTGLNNAVFAIAIDSSNSKVYVGGAFSAYNGSGTNANRLLRLNYDGSLDSTFTTGIGPNNNVNSIAFENGSGRIYIGGAFTQFSGTTKNYFARINPDGTLDSAYASGSPNSSVQKIVLDFVNFKAYLAGSFTSYAGIARKYVAKVDLTNGALDTGMVPLGSAFNLAVKDIDADFSSGKLYVAGAFTSYNGVPAPYLLRLNADGSLDSTFTQPGSGLNSPVNSIYFDANMGKLYAGGAFTRFDKVEVNRVMRFNLDGSRDLYFAESGSGPKDSINGLAFDSTNQFLYVGGLFTGFVTNTQAALELINSDSNLISGFNATLVGHRGGLRLLGTYNRIESLSVGQNADSLSLSQSLLQIAPGSNYNRLQKVKLGGLLTSGSASYGLLLEGNGNFLSDISIFNIGDTTGMNSGMKIEDGASANVMVGALISGTANAGIEFGGSSTNPSNNNIIYNVTTVNNTYNGLFMTGVMNNNLIHNFISINTDKGIQSQSGTGTGSSGNILNNIVSANNGSAIAIDLAGSQAGSFTGYIGIGNGGGSCTFGSFSGNCSGALTLDYTSAFAGKIINDDPTNYSDFSGTITNSGANDWLGFNNYFQQWGKEVANLFPDPSLVGPCLAGTTCRIFDWRTSTVGNLSQRSFNGSTSQGPFFSGSACPSAVDGNVTFNHNAKTFLKHAIEITNDNKGNNDGLCESNEDCIYAPNIGAFQGEGDYKVNGTCIFNNGSVSNVQMFGYPITGI